MLLNDIVICIGTTCHPMGVFPMLFSGSQMSDKQNVKTVLRNSEIGVDARNAGLELRTDTSQERNEKKGMQ